MLEMLDFEEQLEEVNENDLKQRLSNQKMEIAEYSTIAGTAKLAPLKTTHADSAFSAHSNNQPIYKRHGKQYMFLADNNMQQRGLSGYLSMSDNASSN